MSFSRHWGSFLCMLCYRSTFFRLPPGTAAPLSVYRRPPLSVAPDTSPSRKRDDGLGASQLRRGRCSVGVSGFLFLRSFLCSQTLITAADKIQNMSPFRLVSGSHPLRENQTKAQTRQMAASVGRPQRVTTPTKQPFCLGVMTDFCVVVS